MQGERIPIPMYRNERNRSGLRGPAGPAHAGPRGPVNPARPLRALASSKPRSSMQVATRKLVSYAGAG